MRIKFLEEAQLELDEAINFYNDESNGLGSIFLQEVLNAIDRIANYPDAWHPLSTNTSTMSNKAFPIRLYILKTKRLHINNLSIQSAPKPKPLGK